MRSLVEFPRNRVDEFGVPQDMNKRFLVIAAALAALTGCGSSKPGSVPSSTAPPAAVTASASAPALTSPAATASAGTQAAGSMDVQDVSFVSAGQGWALGSGELVSTTDGGASWTRLPAPPASLAHIRFATPQVGYGWTATGSLWITTNGAASWQPGRLTQVISLETAAGWVWSIAGPQPYPSIWRAPVGSTAWTNLGPTPDRTATLTVHGGVAYVVGQQGAGPIAPSLDVFAGTQPVRHESLPCVRGQAYVPFASLGTSTDGLVYLVCNTMSNQPSPPPQTQLAYESVNEGSSWSAASPPPQPPQGVTAVAGERFAWNSGPDLYMLTRHGWHVSLTDPGHGFSLVGFETNTQGVALGTNGYLWITRNGGTSWSRVLVLQTHTVEPCRLNRAAPLRVTHGPSSYRNEYGVCMPIYAPGCMPDRGLPCVNRTRDSDPEELRLRLHAWLRGDAVGAVGDRVVIAGDGGRGVVISSRSRARAPAKRGVRGISRSTTVMAAG